MMELTPEQLQIYSIHYRSTQKQYALEMRRRRQLGWLRAQAAARILEEEFGVGEVYLFGSLLQPEAVHPESDIDLAVTGLDSQRYYEALGELLCRTKDFSVDLVRLEEAQPSFATHILQSGVRL